MQVDNMEDQDAQMLLDSLVAFNQTQQVKSQHTTKVTPWKNIHAKMRIIQHSWTNSPTF